jgi:hypothetical protein
VDLAPGILKDEGLEGEPSGELEGAGVGAGEVESSEGAGVHVDADPVIRCVIAEGDGIGHILAVDPEDGLGPFGDVEGATKSAGETVHAGATQTIGSGAGQVTDHVVAGVAVRPSRRSARNRLSCS